MTADGAPNGFAGGSFLVARAKGLKDAVDGVPNAEGVAFAVANGFVVTGD